MNNGMMNFTDKTSPEDIKTEFNMSKAAFKRALGVLYKNKTIELCEKETKLK